MPKASVSPASTRATTSASGGAPLTSMRPAWRLGRHATGGSKGWMLRTGTGLAIPQELLHGAEVARGPQPLAADGARKSLERGLGTTPIPHVARGSRSEERRVGKEC